MKTPKLGQHFLTRPTTARMIAESVLLPESKTVLEIGPGHGILTRELLAIADTVVAIEKDTILNDELTKTFAKEIETGKLILLNRDIRNFTPSGCSELLNGYSVVANIPYYITGQIIRLFLTAEHQPHSMALLIQKEVAQRIVAKDNKHSLLSLSVHVFGTPKLAKVVKAGAFSPPPKVDSAVLVIENISRTNFDENIDENMFFMLLRKAFSQKRKMIGSTLKDMVKDDTFVNCSVDKTMRPEDVPLETWLCLATSSTNQ